MEVCKAISLIEKRIMILNKLLGKEVKAIKKNPTINYMVANDLKTKIYELNYIRLQIISYHSETKKALHSFSNVEGNKK